MQACLDSCRSQNDEIRMLYEQSKIVSSEAAEKLKLEYDLQVRSLATKVRQMEGEVASLRQERDYAIQSTTSLHAELSSLQAELRQQRADSIQAQEAHRRSEANWEQRVKDAQSANLQLQQQLYVQAQKTSSIELSTTTTHTKALLDLKHLVESSHDLKEREKQSLEAALSSCRQQIEDNEKEIQYLQSQAEEFARTEASQASALQDMQEQLRLQKSQVQSELKRRRDGFCRAIIRSREQLRCSTFVSTTFRSWTALSHHLGWARKIAAKNAEEHRLNALSVLGEKWRRVVKISQGSKGLAAKSQRSCVAHQLDAWIAAAHRMQINRDTMAELAELRGTRSVKDALKAWQDAVIDKKVSRLHDTITAAVDRLAECRHQGEAMMRRQESQSGIIHAKNAALEELKREMQGLQQDLELLPVLLEAKESEISALKAQISVLQSTVLELRVLSSNTRQEALQHQMEQGELIESLSKQLNHLKLQSLKLQQELMTKTRESDSLAETISLMRARENALQQTMAGLDAQLTHQRAEGRDEQCKEQRHEVESALLQQSRSESNAKDAELRALRVHISVLQAALSDVTETVKSLEVAGEGRGGQQRLLVSLQHLSSELVRLHRDKTFMANTVRWLEASSRAAKAAALDVLVSVAEARSCVEGLSAQAGVGGWGEEGGGLCVETGAVWSVTPWRPSGGLTTPLSAPLTSPFEYQQGGGAPVHGHEARSSHPEPADTMSAPPQCTALLNHGGGGAIRSQVRPHAPTPPLAPAPVASTVWSIRVCGLRHPPPSVAPLACAPPLRPPHPPFGEAVPVASTAVSGMAPVASAVASAALCACGASASG